MLWLCNSSEDLKKFANPGFKKLFFFDFSSFSEQIVIHFSVYGT